MALKHGARERILGIPSAYPKPSISGCLHALHVAWDLMKRGSGIYTVHACNTPSMVEDDSLWL